MFEKLMSIAFVHQNVPFKKWKNKLLREGILNTHIHEQSGSIIYKWQ